LPSGTEIPDFYISELPDWVNIIAITKDNRFLVEEQYRHGIQQVCYELPAGDVEPGEDPLSAAKRELEEETGYSGGEWLFNGTFVPNASGAINRCHSFIAKNVEKRGEQQLEITEDIKIHLLSEEEIKTVLNNGLMPEGVMAAPLWKYFANNNNQ
jgi:8-oxo-dGTP pyrophosphatase MutT (NUDIX family)